MPSLSAAQLASRVKQAGDAPDIVKDDITKVTLFDYSDIIGSDTDAYRRIITTYYIRRKRFRNEPFSSFLKKN